MRKRNGRQGSYYLNESGECVAKSCSACLSILHASFFNKAKRERTGLQSTCRDCNRSSSATHNQQITDTGVSRSQQRDRERSVRNKLRTASEILQDRQSIHRGDYKWCGFCQSSKSFGEFNRNSARGDGLTQYCRDCTNQLRNESRAKCMKSHWAAQGIPFDQCIYCQMMTDLTPGDLHGDHVIARAIGGPDEMSNIAPACYACNICKGEDTLEKFLAEQFFYEEDRQEILDRLRQYGYVA